MDFSLVSLAITSAVSSLSFQAVAASVTASTLLTSPQQPQRNTTQGAGIELNPDFFLNVYHQKVMPIQKRHTLFQMIVY